MKSALTTLVLVSFVGTASASVVVMQGNNPEPSEQNVLLNGISGPGTFVSGSTNQTNTIVNFTTTAVNQIQANPNGQSFITGVNGGNGVNGGTFSDLTIALANGGTFTDLIFALDLPGTGVSSACTACVNYSVTGTASGNGTLPGTIGPGTTFFTILASSGQMSSVTLSGVGPQLLEDVRQVRISGVAGETGGGVTGSEVPEPASALLLCIGLAAICLWARHSRERSSQER
jgi:hypothetical protein